MSTTPPALGYGQRSEAPIDAVNRYMRSAPWYQALLQSFGQNPNNVHLSDTQKQQVVRAAQANGIVVDEGHDGQEIDDSGNFQAKSHKLRNTLIVAGIAGAALATMGAAGVFAGGAGAGAAGGGAATAGTGGALASTAAPTVAGVAAGSGAAAGGAGTLGGLAGVGHFLATPGGSTLATSLFGTVANIYGANKQADANAHAAELQDEATRRAEAFAREQAESGWQSGEHTNKANYDQWAARQQAIMGSLGSQLGIDYTAPAYSPGVDPRYTGWSAAPTASAGPAPGGADPKIASFIAQYQASHPVSEGIGPISDAIAKQFPGVSRFMYGQTPSDNELNVPGVGKYKVLGAGGWYVPGTNDGPRPLTAKGTLASFVSPQFAPLQPLAAPTPYQPGTIGAYLGGG